MGRVTSEMNESRTQDTNRSHAPVTRAIPTAISMMPPNNWMVRVCFLSHPTPRSARAEPNARTTKGNPSPMQYATIRVTPRAAVAPSVPAASEITPASVGPRHGPSEREDRTEQRCTGQARDLLRRGAGVALQSRNQADEHHAHDDGDDTADSHQQFTVDRQHGDRPEHRGRGQHEHDGESRDEQRCRPRDTESAVVTNRGGA